MICFSLWFWLWCAFYNRSLKKHIILLPKCISRLANKRIHIKLVSSVLPHQEIVTIISLHLGHSPANRTSHLHLDSNTSHKRHVPDTLWSTKQIEIKYLAQGNEHAGRSGVRTHNIDGRGAGKARFNVATPTNATVTCTAYVLPYNFQTKSI